MVQVKKQEMVSYTMELSKEELGIVTRALRRARDSYDASSSAASTRPEARDWWKLEGERASDLRDEILQQTGRVL